MRSVVITNGLLHKRQISVMEYRMKRKDQIVGPEQIIL